MPARIKKLQQENKELEEKLDALKEAAKGPEEAKAYIEKIRATAQAKREETSFARKG